MLKNDYLIVAYYLDAKNLIHKHNLILNVVLPDAWIMNKWLHEEEKGHAIPKIHISCIKWIWILHTNNNNNKQ